MTIEERQNNTYYDNTGKQILEGDLLKIFHFKSKRKNHYMYHVVVMEIGTFPVLACKEHYEDKPHYRLFQIVENRVYRNAKIIGEKDWSSKRLKININK